MKNKFPTEITGSCGCWLLIVLINISIGALTLNYCIETITGKHAPWIVNVIGGLFLGEITIPTAIVYWILTSCGVHHPFIH
jgi:hypothetical protein